MRSMTALDFGHPSICYIRDNPGESFFKGQLSVDSPGIYFLDFLIVRSSPVGYTQR